MTLRLSLLFRSQSGLTLLETAAVVFIVSIIVVPLLAIGSQFIILPVDWRANVTAMRDAREAVKWVAIDARQATSFTRALEPNYGTLTWVDYTVTPARTFSVRYFYETNSLWREETVDDLSTKRVIIDTIAKYGDFVLRKTDRVVRASVLTTVEGIRGEHQRKHEIAAIRRPSFPDSHLPP